MDMPDELQKIIQDYARPKWTRHDWRTCQSVIAQELRCLIHCFEEMPLDTFYERIRMSILPFERNYNTLLNIFPVRRLRSHH